ncbi:cupin domain-containing protein [Bifidobacterium pseudocatenulatum]|uniref:cupin domain-containing protein n=1 Tax=Bifidobacterium pseudocatenulatum TaxID=28026 RepID=UPI002330CB85|nr:cupin domain-containing protein [Bifidobacterium pseudocatenulatum]MDB6507234.1 cupin domain-containing protein [Bifidobacterium pseudocatenulatum]
MENPSAFPMGEPNDGFAQYFVGQSYLAPVLDAPEISIHNVTFEPGCRNNWHIHHGGAQVLIAVGGRGYYQIEGQEPRELKAGEAVYIPADTKHWHGAAPGESFSHLAFMVSAGDPNAMSNEWLEPVDVQAYESLA